MPGYVSNVCVCVSERCFVSLSTMCVFGVCLTSKCVFCVSGVIVHFSVVVPLVCVYLFA